MNNSIFLTAEQKKVESATKIEEWELVKTKTAVFSDENYFNLK